MSDIDSLVGTKLGRFRILKRVGEGGMGVVFLARDTRLDRDVALKVLWPELSGDAQFVQRFMSEARAAAQLSHPNVVEVYGAGKTKGLHCIAMEFVEGKTLSEMIDESGSIPVPNALAIARGVASALAAAHKRSIVHRDIKPGNIMIDPQGNVRVLDFGLARIPGSASRQTKAGSKTGTPAYMSPEQCASGSVDVRTDVYSLGVTLFELLAGQRPYSTADPLAVMYQIVNEPCPSLGDVALGIPPLVQAVVHTMMDKDPENRYPDGAAAAAILSALESGDEQSVRSLWPLQGPPQGADGGQPTIVTDAGDGPFEQLKALIPSVRPPIWAVVLICLAVAIPFLLYLLPRSEPNLTSTSEQAQHPRFETDPLRLAEQSQSQHNEPGPAVVPDAQQAAMRTRRALGRFHITDIHNPAQTHGTGLALMGQDLERAKAAESAAKESKPRSAGIQGTWDFTSSVNMIPALCQLDLLELNRGKCTFIGTEAGRGRQVPGIGSYSTGGSWPGRIKLELDKDAVLALAGYPQNEIREMKQRQARGDREVDRVISRLTMVGGSGPPPSAGLFVVDGNQIWIGLRLGSNPPKSFPEADCVLYGTRVQ